MFASFDRAVADAVDFFADDIQSGWKLIQNKGVIRASIDEIQGALDGVEATVSAIENPTLFASCTGPCIATHQIKVGGLAPQRVCAGGPFLPPSVVADWFVAIRNRDPLNAKCFDCGSRNVEAADLSFGIFLCHQCCPFHRGLTEFVRDCRREVWTKQHLRVFEHGGNSQLLEFFEANNITRETQQRYFTHAAVWYREAWLKCSTAGWPVPPPPQGIMAPKVRSIAGAPPPSFEVVDAEEIDVTHTPIQQGDSPINCADFAGLESAGPVLYEFGGVKDNTAGEDDLLNFGDQAVAAGECPQSAPVHDCFKTAEAEQPLVVSWDDVFPDGDVVAIGDPVVDDQANTKTNLINLD